MATDVDALSPEVAAMSQNWPMIDALIGGTAAMRAAGEAFLPRWPKEELDSYKARLKSATLYPAYSRTCGVMAAKPFARPVKIENEKDIPASIKGCLDDVDMYGTDLQPFLADVFLRCLQHGLTGVLVDCPPAEGVATRADEARSGIRPYFATYPAATILGWKAQRDANGSHLTQLRLMETVKEPDGDFGEKAVPQIRVLEPGKWQLWRKADGSDGLGVRWRPFSEGVTSIKRIPFVFFYGLRRAFGIGAPPLLDLAFLNVEHWQSWSDQQTILHVARVPILFAKGFSDADSLTIGASTAAMAASKDADLKFVEHTGAAIDAGRQSILDLENRMRQVGAELLIKRPAGKQTATEVRSEDQSSKSVLQKIVEDFEESAEDCLNLMAEWLGESFEAELTLFKDFSAADAPDVSGDLLLRAKDAGVVSRETAFNELQRMDIVSPDIQWADELKRIASDPKPDQTVVRENG